MELNVDTIYRIIGGTGFLFSMFSVIISLYYSRYSSITDRLNKFCDSLVELDKIVIDHPDLNFIFSNEISEAKLREPSFYNRIVGFILLHLNIFENIYLQFLSKGTISRRFKKDKKAWENYILFFFGKKVIKDFWDTRDDIVKMYDKDFTIYIHDLISPQSSPKLEAKQRCLLSKWRVFCKRFSIRYTDCLDSSLIDKLLEIDSLVYPKKLQGTFEEVYGRFCANRDIFILLYDDKKLIGYLCLFPIKDSLYEQITSENKFFDSDIPGDMLEQYKPHNVYKLYLISAAIHPKYQKKGLSNYLIKGFYRYILEKKKKDILFSLALSSAATAGGKLMLERMGFSEKKRLPNGFTLNELIIDESVYKIAERSCK